MKVDISTLDVITKLPTIVNPNTSIKECAKIMKDKNINNLVVKDGKKFLGIITDQDFVYSVIALGLDINKTKVKEIMITDVITINPDSDISEALELMNRHNIKHLAVMNKKNLIGILAWKDVLKLQPDLFELYAEKKSIREHEKSFSKKHLEGNCEICDSFDRIKYFDGQLMCELCLNQLK